MAEIGRGLEGRPGRDGPETKSGGITRGVSTGEASEGVSTTPTDTRLAFFEPIRRPFMAEAFMVRGSDAAEGLVHVTLYRLERSDLTATGWRARKAFTVTAALPAAIADVRLNFASPKNIDPESLWIAGVRTENALATIRGTNANTRPGFHGFTVPDLEPQDLLSGTLTRSAIVPSVAMLSLEGLRLLNP